MATIDTADVRIGAQVGALLDGMKQASSSVKSSVSSMQSSLNELQSSTAGATTLLTQAFGGLTKIALELAAAITGALTFSHAIDETIKFAGEARELAATMGLTRDEAIAYQGAAEKLGIKNDELNQIISGLTRSVRMHGAELAQMGFNTKDASGKTKDMNTLLQEAVVWSERYAAGYDRNAATTFVFGRAIQDVSRLRQLNNKAVSEEAEEMQRLNSVLGVEGLAAISSYKRAKLDLNQVFQGISITIGKAVMPSLAALYDWFSGAGPSAISVIKVAVNTLIGTFELLAGAVYTAFTVFQAPAEMMMIAIKAIASSISQLAEGNFKRAWAALEFGFKDMATKGMKAGTDIADHWKNMWKRMEDLNKTTPLPAVSRDGKQFSAPTAGGSSSNMKQWERNLAEMRAASLEANEQQGVFRDISIRGEQNYWEEILRKQKKGTDDYQAVTDKITALRIRAVQDDYNVLMAGYKAEEAAAGKNAERKLQIISAEFELEKKKYAEGTAEYLAALARKNQAEKEAARQSAELVRLKEKAMQDKRLAMIEIEEADAKVQLEMGRITHSKLLEMERAFEQRRYDIKRQAAQNALTGVNPDSDPVEYAKRAADIEALEIEHQKKMGAIKREQAKEDMRLMKEVQEIGERGFDGFFRSLMDGNKSVKESFHDLMMSIEKEVQALIAKKLAKQLTDSLFGNAGSGGGGGSGSGGGGLDFISKLFGSGGGGGGSGGVGSSSGFDTGSMPSFDIGTPYVPRDMVAKIHKGEAIIPAKYNKGGMGGSVNITNNFHVATPADPRTQTQIAAMAAQASSRAMRRNG